jgi:hypothetical protein
VVVRSDPGRIAQQSSGDTVLESDRYLVPPKTAREYAELHGGFDDANGTLRGDASGYRLGVREAGTLASELGASPQTLDFVPISGVQPLAPNTASSQTNPTNASTEPPEKYVGTGPFPMPYLPDPLAAGIRVAVKYLGTYMGASQHQVAQADLAGLGWPDLATLRLKVVGIDATQTPAAPVVQQQTSAGSENVLVVQLPQSQTAVLSISSVLRPQAMAELALPALLPPGKVNPQQALAGQIYYLTPALDLHAIHATRRPLAIPRWQRAFAGRELNQPSIQFGGQLAIHGPSTGKLSFALAGTDPVDEPGSPPTTRQWSMDGGEALTSAWPDPVQGLTPPSPVPLGQFVTPVISQHLDTRYHQATYTVTASTRFREYFPTTADPGDMIRPHVSDSNSDAALAKTVVEILNTAPPPAPKIVEMLPVFNWEFSEQGGSVIRSRRSVLRVYLERPWFASGDGELLGVIFSDQAMADIPHQVQPYVTQWGRDPILRVESPEPKLSAVPYYGSQTPQVVFKPAKRAKAKGAQAAPPLGNVAGRALTANDFSGATVLSVILSELALQVQAAGYPVHYDAQRDLRFCDITFGDQISEPYFPFIRLALARFQPNSVDKAHISRVVRPDFAQLLPARTSTIIHQGSQVTVRIDGYAPDDFTTFDVFLEQLDPNIGGDLGWQRVPGATFTRSGTGWSLWQGTGAVPTGSTRVRVAIREFEPVDNSESYSFTQTYMTRQPYRLIYADEYELNRGGA